jgi:diguanylate cyclase (GGDEF)-like protein/PAS domain S-box-containing protein
VIDDSVAFPTDQLLESLGVAVLVFDRQGKVLFANQRARKDLSILGDSLGGTGLFDTGLELLDERGGPLPVDAVPALRSLRDGDTLDNFVMGVRSPDEPGTVWISLNTRPFRDPSGEIAGVICSFVDITRERRAQERLRESEERFRVISESAADVVYRFSVGEHTRIDYVNPAVEAVLGYTPDEFYDDPGLIVRVTHPDDVEVIRELGARGVESVQSVQLRMLRRDGTQIWTEHRVVPLHDPEGHTTAVTGIARDVTASKIKEAFLNHRALHDPLTGLPNRVLLLDRLEASLARIRRHPGFLAVLYLDLDRFKTVNDNLGHEVGDRLLQVVAQRLQQILRPSDSVARLGGDEFAAILPDLHDEAEAAQIAERLLGVIAEPVDFGDNTLVTTVSIGVAVADDGETTAGELLRRADFAMYTAKDHGRARVEGYATPTGSAPGDGDR